MTEVRRYRYLCETEGEKIYEWRDDSEGEPTQCKNDPGHTIDTESIAIFESAATGVGSSGAVGVRFCFGDYKPPRINKSSWQTLATFLYQGSDAVGVPTQAYAIVKGKNNQWFDLRIRDVENNESLSVKAFEGDGSKKLGATFTEFAEIPTGPARLEIQGRRTSGGGGSSGSDDDDEGSGTGYLLYFEWS